MRRLGRSIDPADNDLLSSTDQQSDPNNPSSVEPLEPRPEAVSPKAEGRLPLRLAA